MKIYIRNRHRDFNGPRMFTRQAVLWFKPENDEGRLDAFRFAAQCHSFLRKELEWSYGALGRIAPQLVDTLHDSGDSVGILFNHRKYAVEAKQTLKEYDWFSALIVL